MKALGLNHWAMTARIRAFIIFMSYISVSVIAGHTKIDGQDQLQLMYPDNRNGRYR